VYVFAVVALLQTALPMGLFMACTFFLAAYGSYLWRRRTPGARCSELSYDKESWLVLDDATGELVAYTEAYVRFDFGCLIWLVFKNDSNLNKAPRRDVLLFQDQISPDEYRLLRLVLRIHHTRVQKK